MIPFGTYLSRLQYIEGGGNLPNPIHDDKTQSFHFAVLKGDEVDEGEEYMIFEVSTYPQMRELCGSMHAMFYQFKEIMGEDMNYFDSPGVRAALKFNEQWKTLMILLTPYRFPKTFLINILESLTYVLSSIFSKPSYSAAQFVQNSLVEFSKTMSGIYGVSAVLANLRFSVPQTNPNLLETDTILTEVGPYQLISGVISDDKIMENCSLFVFGKILYSNMNRGDLNISLLLVANLEEATEEVPLLDGRVFCLAKHYETVLVSISTKQDSLRTVCQMQQGLMKLDAKRIISKMQQSYAKKLNTQTYATDVVARAGDFVVTQPPFIATPLFPIPEESGLLAANAIAVEMYDNMSRPGVNCLVRYKLIDKVKLRVYFKRAGKTMLFYQHEEGKALDDGQQERLKSIPALLERINSN